jgi:hypothetical protein
MPSSASLVVQLPSKQHPYINIAFKPSAHRPIIEYNADTLLPALPDNPTKPSNLEDFIQHTQL